MRTTTVDVTSFLTPLDPLVVEKRLRALPGVRTVTANFASASATVVYDEAETAVETLRQAVRDMLRKHPLAKSHATAEQRAGGDGVTVVQVAG